MIDSIQRKTPPTVRCAIYTRKSTEEGLEQDYNSLDAQRDAAEAYIASQKSEGWVCLSDRYDDGGYTGGNMDRPAFKRLLADAEAGKIDCIVVYKVDRLSRSLIDFSKIMDVLERNHVSFVSVTQQFNTSTSMGRLMLNVLLSFAQFEREIISERTRDKIAASRRKGKWIGGKPILGYDLVPEGRGVVVNEDEAVRVRQIFELYVRHEALLAVVKELTRRGWRTKSWTTRKNTRAGGLEFDKCNLLRLLTNVVYIGKIRYKDEVHKGEHPAIVDEALWRQVQDLLRRNGRNGGKLVRNKYGALLKNLLYCTPCGCAMSHTYTIKPGKRYRYYCCVNAQKRGWHTCPSKSIPAAEIERFVLDRIRHIGKDAKLVETTFQEAMTQSRKGLVELQQERGILQRDLRKAGEELRLLVASGAVGQAGEYTARIADAQDRIRGAEQRLTGINEQIIKIEGQRLERQEVEAALAMFDPVWDSLAPAEQARAIRLLVERIGYDGGTGTVAITFRPAGIKQLAAEAAVTEA